MHPSSGSSASEEETTGGKGGFDFAVAGARAEPLPSVSELLPHYAVLAILFNDVMCLVMAFSWAQLAL